MWRSLQTATSSVTLAVPADQFAVAVAQLAATDQLLLVGRSTGGRVVIIAVGSWRGTGATTTALLAAACLAATDERWAG